MVVSLVVDAGDAVMARLLAYATAEAVPLNVHAAGRVPAYPVNGTSLEKRNYYPYVVVSTSQRTDTSLRRISDDSTTRPFRVITQFVGQTAYEAEWAEGHVDAALRGYQLTVGGVECSRCHHEAEQPVSKDPDQEDLFVGVAGWTFVATVQD